MKYKYVSIHCSICGKLMKWRRECPKGAWYCVKCHEEGRDKNENHD